jgi:tetratricopeptide (TPR) repeat protein
MGLTPGLFIPFGPQRADGSDYFTMGAGAGLDADFALPGGFFLIRGNLSYATVPVVQQLAPLTLISLGAGPALRLQPLPRLELKLGATAGAALLIREDLARIYPSFDGGLSLSFELARNFNVGLGASYRYTISGPHGLNAFLGVSLGLGGGAGASKLLPVEMKIDPVFPVFYKYYDDNPAGMVVIQNGEKSAAKDVRVSFLAPQFMQGPKECASFPELKPGERREVPVHALFTDAIIGVTEDTKVKASIIVEYSLLDAAARSETDLSLRVLNRNAMTWDDDRKAAAFITAKDPQLLTFAKAAASRSRDRGAAGGTAFRSAIGLFQAMDAYGLRYVSDPASSYAELSKSDTSVDYLQFPLQTLSYRAGDCDDLSILFCAMNEAVGTETALITAPGHIFAAFCPGISPEEASGTFSRPEDCIERGGKLWIPMEITQIAQGFLAAWRTGAREWREADAAGQAGFYPVREAWLRYEPAAFSAGTQPLKELDLAALERAYDQEYGAFVDAEVKAREAPILAELKANSQDSKARNRLGVLYARYGLTDRARAQFEQAAKAGSAAAVANLGNLDLIAGKPADAVQRFKQAVDKDPSSAAALLGLARAYAELGDAANLKATQERLRGLDPAFAEKAASLAPAQGSGRQAEVSSAAVQWDGAE